MKNVKNDKRKKERKKNQMYVSKVGHGAWKELSWSLIEDKSDKKYGKRSCTQMIYSMFKFQSKLKTVIQISKN